MKKIFWFDVIWTSMAGMVVIWGIVLFVWFNYLLPPNEAAEPYYGDQQLLETIAKCNASKAVIVRSEGGNWVCVSLYQNI